MTNITGARTAAAEESLMISDLIIPADANARDADEFCRMVEVGNRMAARDAGIDDLDETAEQLLPGWLDQTDRVRRGFVARRGTAIAGFGSLTTSAQPGTTTAELELAVPSHEWDTGVAQMLLARIEQEARDMGRSVAQTWSLHPAASDGRILTPATGWGAASSTQLTDLLEAQGYTFEQIERNSVLHLSSALTHLEERLAEATTTAGPDYRTVVWTLPTPPHLRTGYGSVIARMATDVPSGDLVYEQEAWDDDRVARRDAQFAAGGQTMSVAAVVHEPTGEMVAFNELMIGSDLTGVTHQWGTLVAREHRGKRLGTIVKCANLLRWRGIAPDSPKVSTFNAEENRPMLDINEAIGFVPASYAGGWQKQLS